MKRIILTESQYKRLVSQPLNEQEIIFGDGYSWDDMKNVNVQNILSILKGSLWYNYKQNLYIKSIDEDKVIIDLEKYDEEVKEYIKKTMEKFLYITDNPGDRIDDKGNVDFSNDTEPVEDEDVVDTEDVVDVVSGGDMECIPTQWIPLFKLIGKTESGSYESLYSRTTITKEYPEKVNGKDPLTMTMAEIVKIIGGTKDKNTAVGRWQFTSLLNQAKSTGLKETDLFSKCNQDKMAMNLMTDKRKVTLKSIKETPVISGNKIAMEWAGIPVLSTFTDENGEHKEGESYYESGKNSSNATPSDVIKVFKKMTNTVLKGCDLTDEEEKSYNDNIKNQDDALDLRWWVHQDEKRLKKINDSLKECGYSDGLGIKGEKNRYTEIIFKIVGDEWIAVGKPEKPVGVGSVDIHRRAQFDIKRNRVSQNLIDDITTAAEISGVGLQLSWARKGHKVGGTRKNDSTYISRHCYGAGIDISMFKNDKGDLVPWYSESDAKAKGIYDKIISFNNQLESMGYNKNSEGIHSKAFLTFGFYGHDNHIHVSNTNVNTEFEDTYKELKAWCNTKSFNYSIKGDEVL
jgi:hypothetical protein